MVTGQAVDGGGLLVGAIQQALGEPIQLPGLDLIITCSIGIATNGDNPSAEAMLRDADTALYQAKAEGRNRGVVFEASMRATLGARVETEAALRYAITHGQLWVAYQPMVDPTTEQTIGAEALIRWTHPDRGSISPAEFIPVAEETGLIKQIGTWVMEESLQQVARWRDDGVLPEKFSMSVNVSARQVHDPGLHQRISEALVRHQISPNRLTVEITESVLMADTQTATEVLTGLRSAGFGLSVDDFGTGYSSLGYLSRFPVTEVKIDRSFVAGLGSDPGAEAIVRAVVAMAAALGLEVVAEGVETPQQRSVLCDLQIHRAQGWLWGAATDGAQFASPSPRRRTGRLGGVCRLGELERPVDLRVQPMRGHPGGEGAGQAGDRHRQPQRGLVVLADVGGDDPATAGGLLTHPADQRGDCTCSLVVGVDGEEPDVPDQLLAVVVRPAAGVEGRRDQRGGAEVVGQGGDAARSPAVGLVPDDVLADPVVVHHGLEGCPVQLVGRGCPDPEFLERPLVQLPQRPDERLGNLVDDKQFHGRPPDC